MIWIWEATQDTKLVLHVSSAKTISATSGAMIRPALKKYYIISFGHLEFFFDNATEPLRASLNCPDQKDIAASPRVYRSPWHIIRALQCFRVFVVHKLMTVGFVGLSSSHSICFAIHLRIRCSLSCPKSMVRVELTASIRSSCSQRGDWKNGEAKWTVPGMFPGNSERRACGCATCSWRPVSGQAHNRFFNEEKRDWGEPIISKLLGRSSL